MNPVILSLLDLAESESAQTIHASSHWQRYGREIVTERHDEELLLQASGFTAQSRARFHEKFLYGIERLSYANVTSRLASYPSAWRTAKQLAGELGTDLTGHERTSATAFAVLADHFSQCRIAPTTFAVIGDGDGFFGAMLLRCLSDKRIKLYAIDLPKMLVFQARLHQAAHPGISMSLLSPDDDGGQADVTFVHPKDIELIPGAIDCAINIVSMQEMNAFSIAAYFAFLRRRSGPGSRFYCVNRWQKKLPAGEVATFTEYPWQADDEVFIDEPCPYLRYFLDWNLQPRGPTLLGCRVPFVNFYDGLLWHRLARLASMA